MISGKVLSRIGVLHILCSALETLAHLEVFHEFSDT